jgi:hypothetical protein
VTALDEEAGHPISATRCRDSVDSAAQAV